MKVNNTKPAEEKQINEEELFVKAIEDRLSKFAPKQLDEFKASMKKEDSYLGVEAAATNALKKMVSNKKITESVAEKIYSQSFTAGQLDNNKKALYDGVGGKNDPTKAVAPLKEALEKMKIRLKEIDAGGRYDKLSIGELLTVRQTKQVMTSEKTSPGSNTPKTAAMTSGAPKGFLLKPETNNEGKMAILAGKDVKEVVLLDSSGKVIDKGSFKSFGDDGSRAKFVFGKQGGDYPKDITVVLKYNDGRQEQVPVANPGRRTEAK